MKSMIIAAFAVALTTLSIALAFADDPNFKSDQAIKKYWEQRPVETGNGGGGGGAG